LIRSGGRPIIFGRARERVRKKEQFSTSEDELTGYAPQGSIRGDNRGENTAIQRKTDDQRIDYPPATHAPICRVISTARKLEETRSE
jgi:hypothetical protein